MEIYIYNILYIYTVYPKINILHCEMSRILLQFLLLLLPPYFSATLQLVPSFSQAFYFACLFFSPRLLLMTGSFGWRSDKQRSSSIFSFSPFYNSIDKAVQDGWQVGRDTLQQLMRTVLGKCAPLSVLPEQL